MMKGAKRPEESGIPQFEECSKLAKNGIEVNTTAGGFYFVMVYLCPCGTTTTQSWPRTKVTSLPFF